MDVNDTENNQMSAGLQLFVNVTEVDSSVFRFRRIREDDRSSFGIYIVTELLKI